MLDVIQEEGGHEDRARELQYPVLLLFLSGHGTSLIQRNMADLRVHFNDRRLVLFPPTFVQVKSRALLLDNALIVIPTCYIFVKALDSLMPFFRNRFRPFRRL